MKSSKCPVLSEVMDKYPMFFKPFKHAGWVMFSDASLFTLNQFPNINYMRRKTGSYLYHKYVQDHEKFNREILKYGASLFHGGDIIHLKFKDILQD